MAAKSTTPKAGVVSRGVPCDGWMSPDEVIEVDVGFPAVIDAERTEADEVSVTLRWPNTDAFANGFLTLRDAKTFHEQLGDAIRKAGPDA